MVIYTSLGEQCTELAINIGKMPKSFTREDIVRRILTCWQTCNLPDKLSDLTPLKYKILENSPTIVVVEILFRDGNIPSLAMVGELSLVSGKGMFLNLNTKAYWIDLNNFDHMVDLVPLHTEADDQVALSKVAKDKIVMDQAFDHLGFLQEARTFIEESIPNDEGLEECMRSAMEIGDWLFYSFDDRGIVDFPGEKYARLIVESLDYEIKTGRYRKGRPLGYRLTNLHNIFYAYFEEEGVIYRYTVIVGELYVYVDRLPYLVDNLEQDGFIPYDSEEEF